MFIDFMVQNFERAQWGQLSLFCDNWGLTCKDMKAGDNFNSWIHLETSSVVWYMRLLTVGRLSAGACGLSMWLGLPCSVGASMYS